MALQSHPIEIASKSSGRSLSRRMGQMLSGIRYTIAVICTVVTLALIIAYPAGGWTQKSFHTLFGRWYYLTDTTGGLVQILLCHASVNPTIGPVLSKGPSPAYDAWLARFPNHQFRLSRNIAVERGWLLAVDRQGRQIVDGSRYAIMVPYWLAVSLATGLSIIMWLGWRRVLVLTHWCRLRPKAGYCPSCGYDLRATPQRCPECGTVFAAVC